MFNTESSAEYLISAASTTTNYGTHSSAGPLRRKFLREDTETDIEGVQLQRHNHTAVSHVLSEE